MAVAGDCALALSLALLVAKWNRGARMAEFLNVGCLVLTAPALPRLLASKRFIEQEKCREPVNISENKFSNY